MSNTKFEGLTIKDYGQKVPTEKSEARKVLEASHGQVWDSDEVRADFEILGFGAPFVVARRRSDGAKGALEFSHAPRFYFDFVEEK